jgi:minor extracellular serine protease Vpr
VRYNTPLSLVIVRMKLYWALVLAFPLAAANVPNRYIVELSTEPVARVAGRARLIHSPAAEGQRLRVRSEQAAARTRIQQAEGVVTGSIENVGNAVVVQIDDAKAARLSKLPGVRKVYPVRELHLMLDHALPLHRVPEAWTQVGIDNAGAGVRIAIIDTGVDVGHPGFQDGGFSAPEGFPRGDRGYTNNKVIVARSYVQWLRNPDPDGSPADHVGHGTATAMAAAGVQNTAPLAILTGVAPRAYIGSYKVFGSPTVNDSTSEDVVLRAIDDAVADGMDVINMSLGSDVAIRAGDDPEMQALENAAALGIVVVCSAGNNGTDPMTVGSPASSASVIAVGSTANDRVFTPRVVAGDRQLRAVPGSASALGASVTAALLDVATVDRDGFACNALPETLRGKIALISRGSCTFDEKLNNAQAAGAVGALVFNNNPDEAPLTMSVTTATLPAEMVSNADGLALRSQQAEPFDVTLDFAAAGYADPSHLETFSAAGPNVDFSIKPDLVAVGGNVYLAAQKLDPHGVVYNAAGYAVERGTSFSAPLVAGAAAVVKAARPGLSAAQYRSLLVNSAAVALSGPGEQAHVQRGGAGKLDLLAAVTSTVAFAPVSLSFGAGLGNLHASRNLTLWNLGTERDTFQLAVTALGGNAVPELPYASVELDPGASVTIPVSFSVDALAAGEYEGFIEARGTRSNVTSRAPYWHGVTSGQARHITIIQNAGVAGAGSTAVVLFRVTDDSGVPVMSETPAVRALSGGGTITNVQTVQVLPYAYDLNLRLGARPGTNVFRIEAGGLTKDVTIIGQ